MDSRERFEAWMAGASLEPVDGAYGRAFWKAWQASREAQDKNGYVLVPVKPTRAIEDAIGRSRNLKASEIWECALAAHRKAGIKWK